MCERATSPIGPWTLALLLHSLALCGIHRYLPASEGPGGIGEQGQNGAEGSYSVLKENCAEETLVSPPLCWLGLCPAGEGLSLRPAVVHPSPPSTAAAVLAPSISAKTGGEDGDKEKRGLLHVSG